MNKNELIESVVKKTGTKKTELEKIYKKCEDEVEERIGDSMSDKEKEDMALRMFHAQVKGQLKSPAKVLEGIVIGVDTISDFGAANKYKNHLDYYKSDPEKAIEEGYVDEEGNPLFLTPEFKKGQPIDVEKEKVRKVWLLAKQEDDKDLRFSDLTLRHNKVDTEIPMYVPIKFRANVSDKSTKELYVLNQSTTTQFEVVKDERINAEEMLPKYLKKFVTKLDKIGDYFEKVKDGFERFVITKGNVSRVFIGDKTNIIEIDDISMDITSDDPETVTVFAHKMLPIDYSEVTPGLIVFGKLNYNEEKNQYTINAFGTIAPEAWTLKEEPKEVQEESMVVEEEDIL